MNIVLEMMALVILALVYALAWHNQPVREPVPLRRTTAEPRTARQVPSGSRGDG